MSDLVGTQIVGFLMHMLKCFVHFFTGLIKQFLKDVDWGDIDYMVIDTPPGTSDEHLSIVQYLSEADVDGAIIVTTPQVSDCNNTLQS